MPTTANFGWTTPTPDGSAGTWDDILNALAVAIDADLQEVLETAEAGIRSDAPGTMEENLSLQTVDFDVQDLGTTSGAVSVDLANGQYVIATFNNTTTITITGWPASGKVAFAVFELKRTSSGAVNWPAAVNWDTLTTYALATNGSPHVYVLWTRDGGTTIRGKYVYNKVG